MSPQTPAPPQEAPRKFQPFVPPQMQMKEFTLRAVLIGLPLTAILGFANAYLGLKAGMTIAATYPAAVIGMSLLRLVKGSILEENITRTIGSIGESVAAGAVFTIPAFVLSGVWPAFDLEHGYWKSVALMAVGGTLGILFVTLLRRVMVEDPDLPFPESVAAAEIHKAGQQGARAAKILFANMGVGAVVFFLGAINLFAASRDFLLHVGELGKSMVKLTKITGAPTVQAGAMTSFSAPAISPAYLGVGYIIGPRLGALNFAGGVLAWGLLVPLLTFTIGPYIQASRPAGQPIEWSLLASSIYYSIVRPIA
ncbi:MAG TPA: OPT/YSL family transporter, partial [Terriglobales bacterium]|nr:OPT/YSL family transporter [Terriglobales bacterium]